MPLTSGARVGPYEIVASLGAGGMGEVYRARDTRLARDVALKILPASFAKDSDRLRRFEQEARATGQLNHPNILAVYDVGTHDGTPYLVEELLEGETLRRAMSGAALPARKAIDYGGQIARGLAAAHEKGVVHRDLKPDNVFVTHDGRIKILDFGLAKLMQPEGGAALTDVPTAAQTGPGVVLGTVGYMSPEQVRGRQADHRSDLFSLGALLYEMLSGRRAFAADSSVETMSAILKEEPPLLSQSGVAISPELERIVQHCLEKNPAERFQSARDLAFQLDSMSGSTATFGGSLASGSAAAAVAAAREGPGRARWIAAAIVAAILIASVAGFVAGRSGQSESTPMRYRPLTFRTGYIFSARFAPDGATVVYSAAFEGGPPEIYVTRRDGPGERPLGIRNAEILSISPTGEMALLLDRRFTVGWMRTGRLARAPLSGGTPREIIDGVLDAEWGPDGTTLAIVRVTPTEIRLEYPPGKVLYTTSGWLADLRFSPDGQHIAFVDHPTPGDDFGRIAMVNFQGEKQDLTKDFASAGGVAWSQGGDAILFAASDTGNLRALRTVDLSGNQTVVARHPTSLALLDTAPDGSFLVTRWDAQREVAGMGPGDSEERNLTWLDWTFLNDISNDGSTVLLTEQGEGGGPDYSAFLRRIDGSPAVKLSSGIALALSPDGKLAAVTRGRTDLYLVPTGAGDERIVHFPHRVGGAAWFPDGRRMLVNGIVAGSGTRDFVVVEGSEPKPITPPGTAGWHIALSPDGRFIAAAVSGAAPEIFPVDGGTPRPIAGTSAGDAPIRWAADGGSLWVFRPNELPLRVDRIDLQTGQRTLWKELMPAERAGVLDISPVRMTADGRAYAYSYRRVRNVLFVAER